MTRSNSMRQAKDIIRIVTHGDEPRDLSMVWEVRRYLEERKMVQRRITYWKKLVATVGICDAAAYFVLCMTTYLDSGLPAFPDGISPVQHPYITTFIILADLVFLLWNWIINDD